MGETLRCLTNSDGLSRKRSPFNRDPLWMCIAADRVLARLPWTKGLLTHFLSCTT